jgi:hypothetical protein
MSPVLLLLMYITYKCKTLKYKSTEVERFLLSVYESCSLAVMEGCKMALVGHR